jgi:RNA polymerase sigma factor (sigma-70 family)
MQSGKNQEHPVSHPEKAEDNAYRGGFMLDSLTLLRAMNGIHEEDVVMAGNIYMNGKSPELLIEEKELEEAIGRFTAGLPETERTVFVLRYWYLAPVAEIADKLQCSQGKIKSILFRTRKKLKTMLTEEGLCWIR